MDGTTKELTGEASDLKMLIAQGEQVCAINPSPGSMARLKTQIDRYGAIRAELYERHGKELQEED